MAVYSKDYPTIAPGAVSANPREPLTELIPPKILKTKEMSVKMRGIAATFPPDPVQSPRNDGSSVVRDNIQIVKPSEGPYTSKHGTVVTGSDNEFQFKTYGGPILTFLVDGTSITSDPSTKKTSPVKVIGAGISPTDPKSGLLRYENHASLAFPLDGNPRSPVDVSIKLESGSVEHFRMV